MPSSKHVERRCVHCSAAFLGVQQRKYCGNACLLKAAVTKENDCWLWPIARSDGRYGVAISGPRVRKQLAHRLSYETFVGPVGDKWVLHKCDVSLCVNPEHLFLGDQADNTADMVRKGRQVRGERSHKAKLTEQAVRAIRVDARSVRTIARAYGVSKGAIDGIKSRKNWKHVA